MNPGTSSQGFVLLNKKVSANKRATCYDFQHQGSGARLIYLLDEDAPQNTFGIHFNTFWPGLSSRAAHPLEHIVFCGSRLFRQRDLLKAMSQASFNTVLNATTWIDCTMYYFSTPNCQDFFNLLWVYLDMVFYPRLDYEAFLQEAWRLEVDSQGKPVYNGIVFNEMAGYSGKPQFMRDEYLQKALFPRSGYGTGLEFFPRALATLSYEELKQFHRLFYHPVNATLFFYGNLDLDRVLQFVNGRFLRYFAPQTVPRPPSSWLREPRWRKPRQAQDYYRGESQEARKEHYWQMVWRSRLRRACAKDLLQAKFLWMLLWGGGDSAPLRRAVLAAGLGNEDKVFEWLQEAVFGFGVKHNSSVSADSLEKIIFSQLQKLAEKGFDDNWRFSQFEYWSYSDSREKTNKGIAYLRHYLPFYHPDFPDWASYLVYGWDGLRHLEPMVEDSALWARLIRQNFLANKHRLLHRFIPDTAKFKPLLPNPPRLTSKQLAEAECNLERLRRWQATCGDGQVPTLRRQDIQHRITHFKPDFDDGTIRGYGANIELVSIQIIFDLSAMADPLEPFVPLFVKLLSRCGSKKFAPPKLRALMDSLPGIFDLNYDTYLCGDKPMPCLILTVECLPSKLGQFMELLEELTTNFEFRQEKELSQNIQRYCFDLRARFNNRKINLAIWRALSGIAPGFRFMENWSGIEHLRLMKAFDHSLSGAEPRALAMILEGIAKHAFCLPRTKVRLVSPVHHLEEARRMVEVWLGRLPARIAEAKCLPPSFNPTLIRELWAADSQTASSALAFAAPNMYHPEIYLVTLLVELAEERFHRLVRLESGAYVSGVFNPENRGGAIVFYSDCDPCPEKINRYQEEVCRQLRAGEFEEKDIEQALLRIFAQLSRPKTTIHLISQSFLRDLTGMSPKFIQEQRERLLAVRKEQVVAAARRYF
ncbi:hypothetical protein D6821_01960, partial [Candidatus Parcubacteria bacterium]